MSSVALLKSDVSGVTFPSSRRLLYSARNSYFIEAVSEARP